MGTRGPVPAPSDQRRRRNASPAPATEQVESQGEVEIPPPSPLWTEAATVWYLALSTSGQSRFYEPSDWANAHFCADLMSQVFVEEKVNAQLVAQVRGLMTDLLVTEGARRRAGMEIVRKPVEPVGKPAGNVTAMGDRRKRLTDAS